MTQLLTEWMNNKRKVVVRYNYGTYSHSDTGYISCFDTLGVTIVVQENFKKKMFPWTSVINIEELY